MRICFGRLLAVPGASAWTMTTLRAGRQREPILTDLHQRIRDVPPGPDGFLHVLTDENPGAVLRIEPAN